ncbi:MAG: glycosyltransferase family 39 protein [Rudaea sp.]
MNDSFDSTPDSRRSSFWLFMLLALLVLGAGIGLRDPWPSDEPRFALAAKQMIESGDWLFPHRGRELYSDKPPMLFWLQAVSFDIFGSWRVAFLMPSLLAGLLTLALTYDLGRRFWNRRVGLYAAIALLFVFQFTFQFKRAQIDPLVTCFITLANWGLLVHFLRGPNWRAFWIGCFAAGLGVVTKGVGVLAFFMFAPYLFARWRRWPEVTYTENSAIKWLIGAAAFALPVLAWALTVVSVAKSRATPEYAAYVQDLFFHQTAGRYAHSWDHAQPFWYYLPIVLLSWLPLSLAYIPSVPRWWRDIKSGEARILLPLAWVVMLVLFFSFPSGKRDVYLMPALPMLALAIGPYLPDIVSARFARIAAFTLALVLGLALAGVGVWSLLNHFPAAERFIEQRELRDLDWIVWVMVVAIGCAMLLSAAIFRPRRGVSALLGAMAGLWLIWSLWSSPMLNDSNSAAGVMRRARDIAGRDTEIGLVAWKEQNLLMLQGPSRDFGFVWPWDQQYREAIEWQSKEPLKRFVFILEDAMGACVDKTKATRVGRANRRDWWMFKADAVVPDCVPAPKNDEDPNAP